MITGLPSSEHFLTINRPQQLNALNKDTIDALHNALAAADADAGVGAIVLTGSGEKAFVAGADIKEFADFSIAQGGELALRGQQTLFDFIEHLGTPVFRADTIEGAKREIERARKRVGISFHLYKIITTEEEVLY